MKFAVLTIWLGLSTIAANAKDIKYPVSAIPEALKKNVNVCVRENEMIFKILSRKSATLHTHYVATIFNTNGQDEATLAVFYDKNIKVHDLKAFVYDANGDVIKKLKTSDITDQSGSDGFSLFTDNRVKWADLSQGSYPYTVEFEYDQDFDFLYYIPGSTVVDSEKKSVQHFTYQLIYPSELKPRFKTYNIEKQPTVTTNGNIETTTWQIENVSPLVIEPLAKAETFMMTIKTAPNDFQFDSYAGSMSSWDGVGKWQNLLNAGRDVLPEETKKKVRELTAGLKTDEEKAKVLYEYMQSKTRYVSIQLGIGGFQPFDAATVDKTGYGDCKALSNYMVTLLKEVGIKAYYCIVHGDTGGRSSIDPTFPSAAGNHIIVAVPNGRDTTWLECTSQRSPYGFIGRFTDNRYVVMTTESGGKIVKTKRYTGDVNVQSRTADVQLDASGNAKAKVVTHYSGLQYENDNLDNVLNLSSEDQKKWIQDNTEIPTFVVNNFSIANKKAKIPTATVQMDLTLNKYASVSNKRIFMTPNLMNRSTFIPEKVENRKTPFRMRLAYTDIDTIRYHIPENIYPEFLPADTKLESRFGTYESGFKLDQGSLIYIRKVTRKDGEFPPEAYQELIDFCKSMNKADNTKLVFLNKT